MAIFEWLKSSFDIYKALIALGTSFIVWVIAWYSFIAKLLKKSPGSSFRYELYDHGMFFSYLIFIGIIIMLLIMAALFFASIYAVKHFGIKMIFPLFLFWGMFIAIIIAIIRYNKKR